jgi:hypothetical protein
MAKLPNPQHTTVAQIYAHYETTQEDGRRPHLGASLIGKECERALWYDFRWASQKKFDGRMLRLFKAGQDFEPRLVAELKAIGVTVHEMSPDGKQWRVSDLGGHFAGSMDGAAIGFPEAPKSWACLEAKTHNDKSFTELVKKGVAKAKPQHYSQMMVYCGLTGMDRAMYAAENKNTSELYFEWVHFDAEEFARLRARAERVITANEPPLRIGNDPSYFVCKWCDHHAICHGAQAPAVSCRTCAHSTAELDGESRWSCTQFGDIGYIAQLESDKCQAHRYIPILLEKAGPIYDVRDGDVRYEGGLVNGAAGLSSVEISRIEDLSIAGEACKIKQQFKDFGAEVVKC